MSPTRTVRENEKGPEFGPEFGPGLADLAEELIRRLGIDDAQRMCRENSWYGVLRLIQGRKNDGVHI